MYYEVILSLKEMCLFWQVFLQRTMTTDEGTSNNGDNPAAIVVEQGKDITKKKDRGVLKVRPQRCVAGVSAWALVEALCSPFGGRLGLSSKHYSSLPIHLHSWGSSASAGPRKLTHSLGPGEQVQVMLSLQRTLRVSEGECGWLLCASLVC